jgi:cyclophilin family peptidyl-prolyl cis-trans isomerase
MKLLALVPVVALTVAVDAGIAPWAPQASLARGMPTCGEDRTLPAPLPLAWEIVVLAGDGRGYAPCGTVHDEAHRERREAAVIAEAFRSQDPELRRLYALVTGWMGHSSTVGFTGALGVDSRSGKPRVLSSADGFSMTAGPLLALLWGDPVPRVRQQAAQAIGEVLVAAPGEFERATPPPDVIGLTRAALIQQLDRESDSAVAAAMLETLARLPHGDDGVRAEVEGVLLRHARGDDAVRLLGAATGLETLIRQAPRRPIAPATRQRLRELVFVGTTHRPVPTRAGADSAPATGDEDHYARVRRLGLLALNASRDDDVGLLTRAAFDADWQVRRLIAARLTLEDPEQARIAEALASDIDAHVRYELLAAVGRYAVRTKDCGGLLQRLSDGSPHVVLRALDLLPADCANAGELARQLFAWADLLRMPESSLRWHVPARALVALARVRPQEVPPLLKVAQKHRVWQVRTAAAAAARVTGNAGMLADLAEDDPEPNVRTAALEGLIVLASPAVSGAAIEALAARDVQLLRTAARALGGAPASARDPASTALLDALARLTRQASDTTRDARVAIVERLGELLPAARVTDVQPFLRDFDPQVREAAAKAVERLTGAPPPPEPAVQYRYPSQPPPSALVSLPTRAVIQMEQGVMELELYPDQAPVTVARFAELARRGHYRQKTFHRVVPNFVIQGGSPGANEYSGITRYMRDEIGLARHVRGAVGISTRGRDTGDGQIFINLVDLPRLDHQYTVFGRVIAGYNVLDAILEGATIRGVSVR